MRYSQSVISQVSQSVGETTVTRFNVIYQSSLVRCWLICVPFSHSSLSVSQCHSANPVCQSVGQSIIMTFSQPSLSVNLYVIQPAQSVSQSVSQSIYHSASPVCQSVNLYITQPAQSVSLYIIQPAQSVGQSIYMSSSQPSLSVIQSVNLYQPASPVRQSVSH